MSKRLIVKSIKPGKTRPSLGKTYYYLTNNGLETRGKTWMNDELDISNLKNNNVFSQGWSLSRAKDKANKFKKRRGK